MRQRAAAEVARRAGHGVAVLLEIYAHCIDGQATAANQRIAEALGIQDDGGVRQPGMKSATRARTDAFGLPSPGNGSATTSVPRGCVWAA